MLLMLLSVPMGDSSLNPNLAGFTLDSLIFSSNGNAPGTADSFKKTEYTYDGRNRLVSAAVYADDNTPNYTQYKYDNVGNTTAVYTGLSAPLNLATTQGADMDYAVTQYAYNELNQPVTMTDALGQTTMYKYDYVGNVTQMTDRNGTVTNVEYNLWGTPVTQSASKDGTTQTITNTYDQLGLLRSATDENGTTTYGYDALGRLTEEKTGDTINSYSYDMYGNRTAYTLTRGGAVLSATSYTYDSMNRLATMTNGGVTTSYTYDANGQVLTEQGGGYSASYTYNDGGLLTAKVGTGAAGELLDVSYSHALDGNILQKNDEDEGVTTYAYDGAGRLTSEVNGQANVTNSYSYDAYGNRTGAVLGGTAVSYTYDKNNRLTKESATAGGTTTDVLYQYDPNGNRVSSMTSKTEAEQTAASAISLAPTYLETALNRYDAFGRLAESEVMRNGALTNTTYTYNASGYRTSKTVDGVTTEHLLDGANVAADVANGQVTQYVRGLGLTALVQDDGTRLQYVTDGHGDVKKLVNSSGAVVADYTYDAFGNQTEEAEDVNPFRYAGEYWDSESGLIYLRARYYDSGVGGFISEDPARDGLNWYVYCGGNPVNGWDPTGLEMAGDEQYSELKQTMLRYLGKAWNKANAQSDRDKIHQVAENLRNFDDSSFNRLIYMNDSDGALNQGHAGILLLNSAGEGLLFSFYPTSEGPEVLNVAAEMRFAVLSNEEAYSLIKVNGEVEYAAASDGDIVYSENYDRFAYYDITNDEGIKMFNEGAWLFDNPGTYNLLGRQCDNIANQIMSAGGYGYEVQWNPNETYDMLSKGRASWSL